MSAVRDNPGGFHKLMKLDLGLPESRFSNKEMTELKSVLTNGLELGCTK